MNSSSSITFARLAKPQASKTSRSMIDFEALRNHEMGGRWSANGSRNACRRPLLSCIAQALSKPFQVRSQSRLRSVPGAFPRKTEQEEKSGK